MPERVLSRPQRNDLFRALEKSGASISEFRLEANASLGSSSLSIRHDATQSYIAIEDSGEAFFLRGAIGNGDPSMNFIKTAQQFDLTFSETIGSPSSQWQPAALPWGRAALPWGQVVPVVEKWAIAVIERYREYEQTSDLWAEFERDRQLFSASSDNSLFAASSQNTQFTEAEREQVSVQIQRIKVYIATSYELEADQLSEVNDRLDQIEEASRRLGRKDWFMAFSGAVFSLILSDLIPPHVAQRVLIVALHGLGHLFGLGGPPSLMP